MNIIAQIVGTIGIIFSLISFQQKKRQGVMLLQCSASAAFCMQLFLVGAITGGFLDLISFARTVIFSQRNRKWASSPVWLILFIVIMIVVGVLTWQNGWSFLAIFGSLLSTVALWMKKPAHIRFVSLFVGPCWLVYNLAHGAYTGALNELLAIVSILLGIIRHDRSPNKYK